MEFKTELVQKLIDDASSCTTSGSRPRSTSAPRSRAWSALMNEQKEKVNLAATGEEESRYAQHHAVRSAQQPRRHQEDLRRCSSRGSQTQAGGDDADDHDREPASTTLDDALRRRSPGDALPAGARRLELATCRPRPISRRRSACCGRRVHDAVDPTADGSVVFEMNDVATLLGFPEFVEAVMRAAARARRARRLLAAAATATPSAGDTFIAFSSTFAPFRTLDVVPRRRPGRRRHVPAGRRSGRARSTSTRCRRTARPSSRSAR